jgi:hypothetical protein
MSNYFDTTTKAGLALAADADFDAEGGCGTEIPRLSDEYYAVVFGVVDTEPPF